MPAACPSRRVFSRPDARGPTLGTFDPSIAASASIPRAQSVAKGIVVSRQSSERILLNDFVTQWREVGADAQAALQRVGESGWLILGREVKSFEAELAAFCQVPHAVGCASGLDAIEIALRVLGLQPGDKVITTPLSAFATTLAIVRAGGVPAGRLIGRVSVPRPHGLPSVPRSWARMMP